MKMNESMRHDSIFENPGGIRLELKGLQSAHSSKAGQDHWAFIQVLDRQKKVLFTLYIWLN